MPSGNPNRLAGLVPCCFGLLLGDFRLEALDRVIAGDEDAANGPTACTRRNGPSLTYVIFACRRPISIMNIPIAGSMKSGFVDFGPFRLGGACG